MFLAQTTRHPFPLPPEIFVRLKTLDGNDPKPSLFVDFLGKIFYHTLNFGKLLIPLPKYCSLLVGAQARSSLSGFFCPLACLPVCDS